MMVKDWLITMSVITVLLTACTQQQDSTSNASDTSAATDQTTGSEADSGMRTDTGADANSADSQGESGAAEPKAKPESVKKIRKRQH